MIFVVDALSYNLLVLRYYHLNWKKGKETLASARTRLIHQATGAHSSTRYVSIWRSAIILNKQANPRTDGWREIRATSLSRYTLKNLIGTQTILQINSTRKN